MVSEINHIVFAVECIQCINDLQKAAGQHGYFEGLDVAYQNHKPNPNTDKARRQELRAVRKLFKLVAGRNPSFQELQRMVKQ